MGDATIFVAPQRVKEAGLDALGAAQDQVVQRRGVRDNHAHGRERIFSNVALSAARSAAE